MQTAHFGLPDEYGEILLVKDARETLQNTMQKDSMGTVHGPDLLTRAQTESQILAGECDLDQGEQMAKAMPQRFDLHDCKERWWSEEAESDEALKLRLQRLWAELLEHADNGNNSEGGKDAVILVTHSHVIRKLCDMYLPKCQEEEDEELEDWVAFKDAFADTEKSKACRDLKSQRLMNCGVLAIQLEKREVADGEEPDYCVVQSNMQEVNCPGERKDSPWIVNEAALLFGTTLVR